MTSSNVMGLLAFLGALALPLGASQAAKQIAAVEERYSQAEVQQALHHVEELAIQGQRLMTKALQVGLKIESERSYEEFQESRAYYLEALQKLQTGDAAAGIPVPKEAELTEPLQALQEVWIQLDPLFNALVTSGEISRSDLGLLDQYDAVLVDLTGKVEGAYQKKLSRASLISIASVTAARAEHLTFEIEHMVTEMLLIAYGYEVELERQRLGKTMAAFEETLGGLVVGNFALKLIPPPTVEVKAQLRTVQRMWDEIAPDLARLAAGGDMDRQTVTRVVNRMEPLYLEMKKTVPLY